ncbi:type I polyketide synthase [Streptomyces tailanensis]|uniref:type I polyketide synthase n=1 Tax=Streptomyces tailanensis TaxID=2569858 RepID=UPI00122E841F|nr:type I polyketide synthase [Streptomyces tailanensis]
MTRIAIIGTACRFPGAEDPRSFWENLVRERDSITRLSRTVLEGRVPPSLLRHPRFVAASGLIDAVFDFDPGLYGMAPAEAVRTDPQHRLFLDVAREALESAGVLYGAGGAAGDVGVYAGVGRSRHEALARAALPDCDLDDVLLETGNEKDYFAARVSYRLGLTGPSVVLQSACSTGLLAVHQAALALAAHECDVALAGAAAVRVPQEYGYVFRHGGIGSASGNCRPFSADADGTVAGDGVACVVLKRLEDALADGDHVHAVVLGSAVNNDGAKAGFASVSAASQVRLMESALRFSGLAADRVGYLEAHGSGTELGDATEWTALERVYRHGLTVGAVKANVGHLREASGLAGLLKAVQVVDTGVVPGSPHPARPAALSRDEAARSVLAHRTAHWDSPDDPRRAAVSSLGLGGTNVHLLLEQFERPAPQAPAPPVPEVLTLSAHSARALSATAGTYARHLVAAAVPLTGAALTLQERRTHHRHRWAVTAQEGSAGHLEEMTDRSAAPTQPVGEAPSVGFVFSGIGDHYPGMAAGLTDYLPGFGDRLAALLDQAGERAGRDLRSLAAPPAALPAGKVDLRAMLRGASGSDALQDPVAAHTVMFCVQQALADALADLGVVPAAVMGHSLGELSAAAVAGVLSRPDALDVVVRRAELVAGQPGGGMLAVALPGAEAAALTGPGVWLATENTPSSAVLAGELPALSELAARLQRQGTQARLLPVSHAFHTPMLAAAAADLAELFAKVPSAPPQTAMVSGLTADWIGAEAAEPRHWAAQLSRPVRFGTAVAKMAERCSVLVEIGPGQLRSVASQTGLAAKGVVTVATVRRAYEESGDAWTLARALGRIWQAGADVNWAALRADRRGAAAPMPPRAADRSTHQVSAVPEAPWWRPGDTGPVTAHEAATPAPAAADAAPPAATTAEAPEAPGMQTRLAAIWQTVLGVPDVSGRDHFFDLGGDSLMGARLIALLELETGVHVPSPVVFESAVLSQMARNIEMYTATETRSS